ncbi:GntR family transcriptional regulator [Conexibacter sp. CPCC 206217]|uniref:GntR family transcriptional regulator n=1 Tax=Conexibacter sp. CPCC 206217 TaxID=3064574 RepID=UPI002719FB21|nr:GntR family transcriptional regulator [Conexibacter sp. CPCC 206217]MDO8210140.1 GntR family transcriptional regulator [Conexibacter sp. CPCC 206217]
MTLPAESDVPAAETIADESGSTVAEAYASMRRAILHGDLEPGKAYSQASLTRLLGIGRTPLREATRRLESEGFLVYEPNRRLRVAPLKREDLDQLYAMRVTLESLAVRLSVPQLTETDIARIAESMEELEAASAAIDHEATRAPHRSFHQGLFMHAGERLERQVIELRDHAERYRRHHFQRSSDELALLQLASADHAEIFAAAASGDALRCSELTAQHLARNALTTFAQLEGEFDPLAARVALRMVRFGSAP